MVTALVLALCTSSDEYLPIIRLYRAKADRNIEVNVEDLSLFLIQICVVIVDGSLVKLEEVDSICLNASIVVESILSIFDL